MGQAKVQWAWPTRAEAEANPQVKPVAFFRFESAPASNTFSYVVEPDAISTIIYAGEMVMVYLQQLTHDRTYKVTLKDASGAEVAAAYLAAFDRIETEPRLPEVTAVECRDRLYADGGIGGMARPSTAPLTDGAKVLVGPGEVVVHLHVPLDVTEEALRAALSVEPAGAGFAFTPGWCGGNILQVRWPGVKVEGLRLPDPLKLAGAAGAPAGLALKMSVTVNAGKLPCFAALAGQDGLFRVDVERKTPPDFTVHGLDDPALGLPYPDQRRIFYLPPGPHRFRLEFTKPMDQASVERSLTGQVVSNQDQHPTAWAFDWPDDQTLDVTLTPPRSLRAIIYLCPGGAVDKHGLPLWFVEGMSVAWTPPLEVVRLRASDPNTDIEVITSAPPGVAPKSWSTGLGYLLGYELFDPQTPGDGAPLCRPWVYQASSGHWLDRTTDIAPLPLLGASWLGNDRIFIGRGSGWEVYDAASGAKTLGFDLDPFPHQAVARGLGCVPDPEGKRVAVLASFGDYRTSGPDAQIWLSLRGLDGSEQAGWGGQPGQSWTAVSRMTVADFYLNRLPVAWIPGQEALVLVDRPQNGPTRLVRLDLATGQVVPLPRTDGASRWPPGSLAVFGADPVYCTFLTEGTDGNLESLVLYDLSAEKVLFNINLNEFNLGGEPLETCLPSPDGRYLAVGNASRVFLVELRATGPVGVNIEGSAAGWSSDGQWLYVARPRAPAGD